MWLLNWQYHVQEIGLQIFKSRSLRQVSLLRLSSARANSFFAQLEHHVVFICFWWRLSSFWFQGGGAVSKLASRMLTWVTHSGWPHLVRCCLEVCGLSGKVVVYRLIVDVVHQCNSTVRLVHIVCNLLVVNWFCNNHHGVLLMPSRMTVCSRGASLVSLLSGFRASGLE